MKYQLKQYELTLKKWEQYFGDWFLDKGTLQGAMMEKDLYPYSALFEPIKINSVTSSSWLPWETYPWLMKQVDLLLK